jgi:hypothetical protein
MNLNTVTSVLEALIIPTPTAFLEQVTEHKTAAYLYSAMRHSMLGKAPSCGPTAHSLR